MSLVSVVLPVFIVILLGYSLVRLNCVKQETAQGLGNYIFWAAGPAIIFMSLQGYNISEILLWKFWAAYFLCIVSVLMFTYLFFRIYFKESNTVSYVMAFCSVVKNTIIIGLPLLISIVGNKATIPVIISIIIFNCIFAPILVLICEVFVANREHHKKKTDIILSSVTKTFKNPFVFSAFIGIFFSALHITVPNIIGATLHYLSLSFIPCALFAVGIELSSFKFKGNFLKTLVVSLINLIVCPLVAIAVSYLFDLSVFYAISLVILSSMPTAKSMYAYINKYEVFNGDVAGIISFTTALSLITIPFFIWVTYCLWSIGFQH